VDVVGEAVQEGSGEPFVAHHLDPVLEGQVGGDDQAGAFVGAADGLKEQFAAGP
jgi:ABC-type sulfate transport system permease subunit